MTVALVMLGLPLALTVRALLTSAAFDELQREAEQAQLLVEQEAASVRDVALLLTAFARESGTRLSLVDGSGLRIDTGPPPADEPFFAVTDDLRAASRGQVGRVHGDGLLAVAVPVRGAGIDLVMRASRDDAGLREAVTEAWLRIGVVALAALAVAAAVAVMQARRLAAPLEQLAAAARRLGDGDFSARAPHSGVPELDQAAAALEATASRLATLLERSRTLSADASHQLRTPLTALRLQLEALEAAAEAGRVDRAAVADAVAEADRLETTIDELVALTAPGVRPEPVDPAAIVRERLGAWQALARSLGRSVELVVTPAPPVRVRPAAVGQSLQVLLDNALEHGTGAITVVVEPAPGGVRLCVRDEGPGPPADLDLAAPTGPADRRGRGLPLARALVESEGGRLRIVRDGGRALVCVLLPAADGPVREAADGLAGEAADGQVGEAGDASEVGGPGERPAD